MLFCMLFWLGLECFSNQADSFLQVLGLHEKLFLFGFHIGQVVHGILAWLSILHRAIKAPSLIYDLWITINGQPYWLWVHYKLFSAFLRTGNFAIYRLSVVLFDRRCVLRGSYCLSFLIGIFDLRKLVWYFCWIW